MSERLVSSPFRSYLLNYFSASFPLPLSSDHKLYLRLLQHLVFGRFHKADCNSELEANRPQDGFVLADLQTLASIAGCQKKNKGRNFKGKEFLNRFELATGLSLEYQNFNGREYCFTDKKAREIRLAIPDDLLKLAYNETLTTAQEKEDSEEQPVYFVSGERWSERKALARYNQLAQQHEDELLFSSVMSDLNRPIVQYMASLKTNSYAQFLPNVKPLLLKVRNHVPKNQKEADQQIAVERNLIYFLDHQTIRPMYKVNENRPRVFAMEYSLLTLPKVYRRQILAGTFEADLKSAHTFIAAFDMDIPELKELFDAEKSFWDVLIKEIGVSLAAKPCLKNGVYAVLYGAGKPKILEVLDTLNPEEQERFLKCGPVNALLAARKERIEEIKKKKGWESLGEFLCLKRFKHKAHTLMSIHAQRIETFIIAGCYEEAAKGKKDFRILSAEHDGFSFQMLRPERTEQVKERLQKAVAEKGKSIGIQMILEFSD